MKDVVNKEPHPADVYAGRMLKLIRQRHGINQTKLGQAVGVTFQQIQKYENGSNRMSVSRLWEFCQFLQVDPVVFFMGRGGGK